MKSVFIITGMLLSVLNLKAQTDSITISGTLNGIKDNKVIISFKDENGKNVTAAARGINDKFLLKVPAQVKPVAARLSVSEPFDPNVRVWSPPASGDIFIGKNNLRVEGDADRLDMAMVTGDKDNDIYAAFLKQENEIELRLKQTKEKSPGKESYEVSQHKYTRQKEFVKSHPDAFISVVLLSRLGNFYTADDYLAAWNLLSPVYKTSGPAQRIKAQLNKVAATMAGTPVFAFERLDKDGNKVSPELLKGKTYLLDFWGSWCGPCRASHPHLKNLYAKYKSKGFEIVAIAHERGKTLDESKASWLKAIQEDQINWVHILNQDGIDKQNLVKAFHIDVFPTKLLVDSDGKIVLRISASATDDIDKALERIYGF